MRKNLLKISSAKLTAFSIGLLLAVFCTIGMSFTPADEGDNIGDPNDTTYVTGPRRSHWTTSGDCGGTNYNNNKDYGKVAVTVVGGIGGTVSASGNNGTSSTASNNTTSVTVTWNCGYSDTKNHTDLTAKHTNKITFTASPSTGYNFEGWYTDAACTQLKSSDLSYSEDFVIDHGSWGTGKDSEYESSSKAQTWNRYAKFVEIEPVDLTFIAPAAGGQYTVTVGGSSSTVSSANVVKTGITTEVTLEATSASGYMFAGWYQVDGDGNVTDLGTTASYNKTFAKSVSVGARFISTSTSKFKNITKNAEYYGLRLAILAASANDVIIPVAEETVVDGSDLLPVDNGTYTLPAGVKLLIPYSSANDFQTLPKVVKSTGTLSAYRKLILMDGVNIVVSSGAQICVAGQAMAGSGGSPSGYTTGACGVLDMSRGGHMELNDGSTLYCWGFVKGQDMDQGNNTVGVGTISVNSGATVWETFSVGDWRGGSATSSIVNTRFFPFQSYFMQNIEVPTTYWEGSSEWCYFTLNATGGPYDTKFAVIGSSNCLFKLTDAQSKVRKWYDPTTDLMCYELSGSAVLDELKIKITGIPLIGTIDIQSSQFDLPIPSNMHLILANCNMNLTKPLIVQPGAIIEIKNSATVTLSTNLYMYDKDDWGPWVCGKYFKATSNLTTHKNRGDGSSNSLLDDAKFIIDGSFTIGSSGKLYSTAGGAALVGNGGGTLTYPSSLPSSTTLKWYKSTTTSGDGETGTVAVNNANPCNEDASYTKAIASKTFHNKWGRWFVAADKDERADHTYAFTYISSGAVSGTGGTSTNPAVSAVYAPDKTGLVAGMKWCNVAQDATCANIYNATQSLNGTDAANIRYTYQSSSWLQLLRTETEGVYGGSDNSLYAVDGCAVNSLGSVDENCLYTIGGVKKALVDGHFVALEKNTEDEAWHDVANPTNYYISFAGCTWHPATKYAGEEKAYIVEEGDYIWYNNDWLLVEREDPFFFDYNDQNVKRYYEYEDGAWVLASPRVRVVDAIETREFYKLPEAITVASGKKNTTITILKDISGINTEMTYTAKNTTCTLDLNGHTVSGACAKLLTINASGSTFTITDNTTEKNGRLENIFAQNAVTYNVTVTAGTVTVLHGTIHAENPAQYASKAATVNDVAVAKLDACGARAVQVAAAQKLNLKGGRLEAYATRNAYGVVASGTTANTTVVSVEEGAEVYAEAPCGVYGINSNGKLNISGGLVEAKLNDHLVDAAYAADDASNNLNKHQTCYAILMGASASATASSCYYGTLTVTGGTIKASSDLVRSYTSNVYGIYMNVSIAGMGNRNFASTSGTNAEQACAIGSVKNAEIIVDNKANYGYGINVYGKYNSSNKSNSVFKIENTTVDVKAYNYAYGVYAYGGINGTTGECYTGDVEMTNCTVTAEATTASYAYGALVYAGQTTIYKDKQANYYGEYATAAKMTINGGTITAKAKNHYAYATTTSTRAKTIYNPENSAGTTIGEGKEAYPTLIINGGTYNATTGGYYARGVSSGGNTTISDATFNVTAGSYYAYGLYAVSGKLTATNVTVNNTAKGRVSSSDNNAYAYGVYADCGIISSGNQPWTGYAYASDVELNNCTVTSTATTYNNARGLCVEARQALLTQANFDKQKTTSSWSDATYNLYASVFPGDNTSRAIASKATVNGGTFTVTAKNATAYGALSTKTVITNTQGAVASPEMTLNNATFIAKSMNSTSAYGVYSGGPTTIDGCTITATAGDPTIKNTASGVLNVDKVTKIKNSTITATSADAAYGLEGRAEINATHGYCWHGDFDLSEAGNTTITAEAKTSGKTAYTIYLLSAKKNIATGSAFDGDYATAANATINGGTYVAKFNTSGSAYVISLGAKQTQGSVVAQPEVEVLDGFFNGATAEVGTAGVVGHMQLKGGYFVHPTNLATYAVAPKSVWTLPNTHEHYNPYKYKVTEHYTITFKNGTTQLQQNDLEAGSIPAYTSTPTKDADAQYTYTFDGWSTTDGGDKLASLPAVSADATYFAHYDKTVQNYTISIASNDGEWGNVSAASVTNVPYGTSITTNSNTLTVNGTTITATPAASDAQYTYTFDHWDAPKSVTGATDIQAVFTRTLNTYTVTWKNEDGTPLETDENVEYGATPTYDGATPTKAADADNTYTFNSWTPDVGVISGTTVYTATYTSNPTVASVTASDGTKYYATVEDAIEAANGKSNASVTMLRSTSTEEVQITAAMTIDLNGKTITSTENTAETGVFKINASGKTVTIGGTSGEINHTANCAGKLYGINIIAGTLEITGGHIYAENTTTSTSTNYRAYGIHTNENATEVKISGGTIEAKRENKSYAYGIYTDNTCKLTMTGGEFKASGNATVRGIYVKGTTQLTDATITATGSGSYAVYVGGGSTTINSGWFKGAEKVLHGSATVKGGYYSNNAEDLAEKCATNYHVLPNADANYPYKVAEAYTVTFIDGDNNTIQSSTVEKNTTPVYSGTTPTKSQTAEYTYSFNGTWNPAISAVTVAAIYTAQFDNTPRSYTLTWNTDGNALTGSYTNGTVAYGTTIVQPNTPTKTGYTFASWTPSVAGTMPAANTTYTATWTPTNCNISYNLNGGSVTPDNANPTSYTIESNDITLINPTKEHYTFAGWTGSNGSTPQETVTIASGSTGKKSYTANWTPVNYTISYDLNEGSATNPTSYNIETATFTLANPTRDGYTFKGWTGSNGSTPEKTVTIAQGSTGDKSYTAQWVVNYTITWMDGSDVKLVQEWPEGSIPSYNYQKQQTAQYTFELIGWSDENQTKYLFPATLPAVTRNAIYTAQCKNIIRSYTIQFVNDDNAVLQSSTLRYGATPMYDYNNNGTPVSSNKDERITRTFIGWSPSIVDVVGSATYKAQYQSDIIASENSYEPIVIEPEQTVEVITTTVETTGKLQVEQNATLTTNTLILQATAGDGDAENATSGEITGAEYINTENTDVYYDLTLNTWARHWHAFGVPWKIGSLFDTKLVEIKDKQGNDCHNVLILGRDYDIIYYNGEKRAAQGPGRHCWDYVEDGDGTLTPGKAYMIGFIKPTGTVRFAKAADAAITTNSNQLDIPYYEGNGSSKDAGWNAIANPKTYHANMNAGVQFCHVHNADTMKSDGFTTVEMSTIKFVVGKAVYVQTANNQTTIVAISHANSAHAPRRSEARSNAPQYYAVHIMANGKSADRIYVKADEDKEENVYTNGIDVAKMGVSTVRAQMWIERYDTKLAVNTMAPVNNTAAYPLGISIPQAGEYEISSPAGENGDMLYLTYDGRIIWNLTYAPYSASFEKGTNTHYGLKLVRSNAPAVTTDMEQSAITDDQSQIMKVLIDDKVYILRGGEIYTITGQKAN